MLRWAMLPVLLLMALGVLLLVQVCFFAAVESGRAADKPKMRKTLSGICFGLAVLALGISFISGSTCFGTRNASKRNRTSSFHRGIMEALENYRSNYGEYPSPQVAFLPVEIDGGIYNAAGALMLYQALSGDGDDQIRTAKTKSSSSDGRFSDAEETNAYMRDMPRGLVLKTAAGYVLVDGYGHPFQYTLPGSDSINDNYDLWSYAETAPPARIDKAVKRTPQISDRWIKNW